jgi:hypothetical protein
MGGGGLDNVWTQKGEGTWRSAHGARGTARQAAYRGRRATGDCTRGSAWGERRWHVGRIWWTWTGRPGPGLKAQCCFSFNSKFQTNLNLQWFKIYLPVLKKSK